MPKDPRYSNAQKIILGGYMKTINELYDVVPKSTVAKDLGINGAKINALIKDPVKYGFKDMVELAALLEVDELQVMTLVYNQYQLSKKPKRRAES